ncbi:MAG: hypothetical protein JW838_00085 [Spirochaetes bacterium]|nr:hypothetical protein [Spirochaetota bacterium]
MKKSYIVYTVLTLGCAVLAVLIARADIMSIIDPATLAIILGPTILMLLSHFGPRDCVSAFRSAMTGSGAGEVELKNSLLFFSTAQTLLIVSGIAAVFIGLILILDGMAMGKAESAKILARWFSVDIIAVLYTALLMILVTVPFKSAAQKRLNELRR